MFGRGNHRRLDVGAGITWHAGSLTRGTGWRRGIWRCGARPWQMRLVQGPRDIAFAANTALRRITAILRGIISPRRRAGSGLALNAAYCQALLSSLVVLRMRPKPNRNERLPSATLSMPLQPAPGPKDQGAMQASTAASVGPGARSSPTCSISDTTLSQTTCPAGTADA